MAPVPIDEEPTVVASIEPPATARMRAAPPRPDFDLNDISGARAIAIGLLALFFVLLLVILGVGPL